jgi:hypothetical protein
MALENSFGELDQALAALREAVANLHVAVVEDGPERGAPLLVDQLGDAATELAGWVEEASRAAAAEPDPGRDPRTLETIGDRVLHAAQRCHELFSCERVQELGRLGRERGREWSLWSASIVAALERCQQALLDTQRALLTCRRDATAPVAARQ